MSQEQPPHIAEGGALSHDVHHQQATGKTTAHVAPPDHSDGHTLVHASADAAAGASSLHREMPSIFFGTMGNRDQPPETVGSALTTALASGWTGVDTAEL